MDDLKKKRELKSMRKNLQEKNVKRKLEEKEAKEAKRDGKKTITFAKEEEQVESDDDDKTKKRFAKKGTTKKPEVEEYAEANVDEGKDARARPDKS